MLLRFQTTVEEHKRWALFVAHEAVARGHHRRRVEIGVLLVAAILFLLSLVLGFVLHPVIGAVGAAIALAASTDLWRHRVRNATLQVAKRLDRELAHHPPRVGATTLELSADGIREDVQGFSISATWLTVTRVIVTSDHVFVETGSTAFVIPTRAFETPDIGAEVVATAARSSRAPVVGSDFVEPRPPARRPLLRPGVAGWVGLALIALVAFALMWASQGVDH